MNRTQLEALIAMGESEHLELKKSTGDLRGGMEALCAFLNAQGGTVAFGVTAAGRIVGQDVTDATLREVAVAVSKLDPPDFPQCGLRMARFRGVRKDEFLDQRQLHGNAFVILEEAMLFLRRHLPVTGRFEPGVLTRLDEPLFPVLALREAVVNAICHRDYSIVGGAISIAVFDDRLEVISTGDLPFGLTPPDLKREHESKPRNPLLAEVF